MSHPAWRANLLLALVASLLGLVLTEVGYRAYLYLSKPDRFKSDRNLWYFQTSPYRFNAQFGYDYVPGSYSGGAAYDGKVIACWDRMEEWEVNALGTAGRLKGSYPEARLKVLVFGDSFTQRARVAPNGDYMTWPNYLQDFLERDLGVPVNVINFGRDAYGILQMFDLAAAKVGEWKPDLAIITFITDDITRGRFWRTTTEFDGRLRIMTSLVPDSSPGWSTATDAYLLEPKATSAWCHATMESGKADDPIVRDLEKALQTGRRHSTVLADPFSLSQSFVLDRVLHGDAFHSTYSSARPSQLPRHRLQDFAQDERTKANVEGLRALGIPVVVIHLATYSEIVKSVEYGTSRGGDTALVKSLERLLGVPVRKSLDHLRESIPGLDSLPKSAKDEHPSLWGHRFYAETVLEILNRTGTLERAIQQARTP